MKFEPRFVKGATNVYRTRDYIVKQGMGVQYNETFGNVVFSRDTYYRRTPFRDWQYERYYHERANVDGKRLPSTMYARVYLK